MTTYRLAYSGFVYTPGFVAWGQNGYHFEDDVVVFKHEETV